LRSKLRPGILITSLLKIGSKYTTVPAGACLGFSIQQSVPIYKGSLTISKISVARYIHIRALDYVSEF